MCAGHYLATGHPALCYMQNSGLGNVVNPVTSLMDPEVYNLPCLMVIGWRGEPGVHDEPQHVKQGAITTGLLDLLGIPYRVISKETTPDEFRQDFCFLIQETEKGKCAAFVVRKGALECMHHPDYRNAYRMTRERAAEIVTGAAGEQDIFVSTTGKLSREIFEMREARGEGHEKDFLTVGSMGHASMIALEIANCLDKRRVWCLDGDGAMMMHLGAVQLIGQQQPKNFVHAVINNGAHETVGGMPVCDRKMNMPEIAKAAGYRHVLSAEDEEELKEVLSHLPEDGPVMIEIKCANGARADLGRPTTTPAQNRDQFMKFLQE